MPYGACSQHLPIRDVNQEHPLVICRGVLTPPVLLNFSTYPRQAHEQMAC